jgi:hypothetical protein
VSSIEDLASYHRCLERIHQTWGTFLERRQGRLAQQVRLGIAAEKVAENIMEDLCTIVLDWKLADLNNQVQHADLLLSRLGIKYLLLEMKRPGALAWNRRAVEAALDQARRYAAEQKVACVGISDGIMLYAADIEHGGARDRVFVHLESPAPPDALWWLSVHGIYRPREEAQDAALRLLPDAQIEAGPLTTPPEAGLLHPKYRLPAHCFAYVKDAADPRTWKLPYLLADGRPDGARLPKAIQAVLSNYRGTKVSGIPDRAIPDVLARLGQAACGIGKMPFQGGDAAPVYNQLAAALDQVGRLEEIKRLG